MSEVTRGTKTFDAAVKKSADELKNFFLGKQGIPTSLANVIGQYAITGEYEHFQGGISPKTPLGVLRVVKDIMAPISAKEIGEGLTENRPEAFLALLGFQGRASPSAQRDILYRHQEDINPTGESYNDASPKNKAIMNSRFPNLYKMSLERMRGDKGKAAREVEAIRLDAYTRMQIIEDEYLQEESWSPVDYRRALAQINNDTAITIQGIHKTYGLYQEDRELPVDPNDRALAEHYQIYDDAKDELGNINWEQVSEEMSAAEARWTNEQQSYVDTNSNVRVVPPRTTEFSEAKKVLEPYFKIGKDYVEKFPKLQSIVRVDGKDVTRAELWTEYIASTTSSTRKQHLRRYVDGTWDYRDREREAWMAENADAGLLLVRWYQKRGVTYEQEQLYHQLYPR